MAESLDPAIQSALDAGRVIIVRAVSFALDSGTYGLWTGEGTLQHGGVDFLGAAEGLLSISPIRSATQGAPGAMKVVLTVEEDGKFDPANLINGIEVEAYPGRPMIVYDVFLHPDTLALLGSFREAWTGVIDTIPHRSRGGMTTVTATGEQKVQFDMSMAPKAVRSDASQRRRNPTDGFLRHVTGVARPVYLGRQAPTEPN